MSQENATSGRRAVADSELVIQVLSLEYQTLRDDMLVRSAGRFQFLGLMTTAAALLASGVLGHSIFGEQTWIAGTLAAGVLGFGFVCFLLLGRHMATLSARIAEIEQRINALVPAEPGWATILSWESGRREGTRLTRLLFGIRMQPSNRSMSFSAGTPASQTSGEVAPH